MAKTATQEGSAEGSASAENAPLPDNYETALAELEGLVARMEGGALDLGGQRF